MHADAVVSQRDPDNRAGASKAFRRGYLLVPSVVVLTIVCTLVTLFLVSRWEEVQSRKDLAVASESHFVAIQNSLDDHLRKLTALRALFGSSTHVSRAEFALFTEQLLRHESDIQNLSWAPRIAHADRVQDEATAILEGIPAYRIKAALPDRSLVPSEEYLEYLPIYYTSGRPSDSRIHEIDLWSQPVFRDKMGLARDSDRLSVVSDFVVRSIEGDIRAFVFSLPVYDQSLPHDTVELRRRNLKGFVHGTFQIRPNIEHSLNTATTQRGLDLYIFPRDADPDALPLYYHASRLRTSPAEELRLSDAIKGRHVTDQLVAGDANWVLAAVPLAGGPMDVGYGRSWLVLAIGIVIGLIVFFQWGASMRHARRLSAANARISDLTRTDALTGLMNRRAFAEQLEVSFAACRRGAPPFALLYFDLDNFKDVNDTRGHQVGDLLLQQVIERVRDVIRRSDVMARFGGDEFALLQAAIHPGATASLAAKINELLAFPFLVKGDEIQISTSIGIAEYSDQTQSPDALLMQADLALYRAKEDGRNGFRFHSQELDQAVNERVMVASELRAAIKCGDLRLFYQPQIDLASGKVVGVEALVRWQHPQRGLIGPAHFIAIAERTGTIIPLGEWVLEEACRQMKTWRGSGIGPGFVAVNCSVAQFKNGCNFERFARSVLKQFDLAPSDIELEVTESVLMEATQHNSQILEGFRRLGVGVAIDDFGTGYSSLSYLAQYPVSRLKIAQELVFGAKTDVRHATVVRTAIQLARELGIHCIAEGVETREQADFLAAAGCQAAQGYFFSRPISAQAMTTWLQERSTHKAQKPAVPPPLFLVPNQPLIRVVS
jgi:diguanylate cyclase